MLERLRIKNFQSLTDLTVDFDPHVTVLVGDNGAGKSAVLRALKWIATNRPLGMEFVGDWGKADYAFAKAWIDGRTISRKKGKGVNEYRLDGAILSAIGSGSPPTQVTDAVQVHDINFQDQHDGPLWFKLPNSQVSHHLNELLNLGQIDAVLSLAASACRDSVSRVRTLGDILKENQEAAKSTQWAIGLRRRIIHVSDEFLKIEKLAEDRSELHRIVVGVQSANDMIRRSQRAIKLGSAAVSAMESVLDLRRQLAELNLLANSIHSYTVSKRYTIPDIRPLQTMRVDVQKLIRRKQELEALLFGYDNHVFLEKSCDKQILELQKELDKCRGQTCPTCKRPLTESPSASSRPIGTLATKSQEDAAKAARVGMPTCGRRSTRSST